MRIDGVGATGKEEASAGVEYCGTNQNKRVGNPKSRNAERPDAREIINSFDLLKLTLNANVERVILYQIC